MWPRLPKTHARLCVKERYNNWQGCLRGKTSAWRALPEKYWNEWKEKTIAGACLSRQHKYWSLFARWRNSRAKKPKKSVWRLKKLRRNDKQERKKSSAWQLRNPRQKG